MTGSDVTVSIITGPTAVGKTSTALGIAEMTGMEIISADSRQVYTGMDIGTAKPTGQERVKVRHHLIDVVRPDEEFNAAIFKDMALAAIDEIHSRSKRAVIVGGTGLYLRALLEGLTFQGMGRDDRIRKDIEKSIAERGVTAVYAELKAADPVACEKIHPNNIPRIVRALEVIRLTGRPFSEAASSTSGREGPAYNYVSVCMNCNRDALYRRIDIRVQEMVDSGWVDEVRKLAEDGYSSDLRAMNAIGYREILDHVEGKLSLDEAVEKISRGTRNFAQRQLTFFRGLEGLRWLEIDDSRDGDEIASTVAEQLGV